MGKQAQKTGGKNRPRGEDTIDSGLSAASAGTEVVARDLHKAPASEAELAGIQRRIGVVLGTLATMVLLTLVVSELVEGKSLLASLQTLWSQLLAGIPAIVVLFLSLYQ